MTPIRPNPSDDRFGEPKTPKLVAKFRALPKGERVAAYVGCGLLFGGLLLLMLNVISSGHRVDFANLVSNFGWFSAQAGTTILIVQFILHQLLTSPHRALVEDAREELAAFLRMETSAKFIGHAVRKIASGQPIYQPEVSEARHYHLYAEQSLLALKRGTQVAQSLNKQLIGHFWQSKRLIILEGKAIEIISECAGSDSNILKGRLLEDLNSLARFYDGEFLNEVSRPPPSWIEASRSIRQFYGWPMS